MDDFDVIHKMALLDYQIIFRHPKISANKRCKFICTVLEKILFIIINKFIGLKLQEPINYLAWLIYPREDSRIIIISNSIGDMITSIRGKT